MSETISQLWPWDRSLLSFRKGFQHSEETICIIWPKENYKQVVISCLSRNYLLPFFTFLVVYVGFLSIITTTKQHLFNSEDHFCEYVHHEHRHGSTSTHGGQEVPAQAKVWADSLPTQSLVKDAGGLSTHQQFYAINFKILLHLVLKLLHSHYFQKT